MIWIGRIHLAQKLDAVHEPGHTRGDVVIAVEPDRAVCDCFGGLCVRAGDGDVVGSETFLELSRVVVWLFIRTREGFGTYWKSQGDAA